MCLGCWDEEGRPFKMSDAVREWAPKFEEASSWGAMHIVREDWNLDDGNIEFCLTQPDITPSEIDLCKALLAMTIEERWATAITSEDDTFDPRLYS